MGNVFINYRRDDSIATAGRLHDRLAAVLGRERVFMDVDQIPAGVDFLKHLSAQLTACSVPRRHWAGMAARSRRVRPPAALCLDQPITVADLVAATGVAGHTLFMHFKEFQGVSPMRYLRDARLRQVRRDLLRAEAGASVTDIAMSAGFTHMGRFSVAYRRHFGESPSETLRRKHQRRAPVRSKSCASHHAQSMPMTPSPDVLLGRSAAVEVHGSSRIRNE